MFHPPNQYSLQYVVYETLLCVECLDNVEIIVFAMSLEEPTLAIEKFVLRNFGVLINHTSFP